MPPSGVDLGGLQTENSNPRTATIDKVSTEELCRILHEEDCRVPAAVTPCLPEIAATIDALTERVRKGGRVFYIGAGTSGRYVCVLTGKEQSHDPRSRLLGELFGKAMICQLSRKPPF